MQVTKELLALNIVGEKVTDEMHRKIELVCKALLEQQMLIDMWATE